MQVATFETNPPLHHATDATAPRLCNPPPLPRDQSLPRSGLHGAPAPFPGRTPPRSRSGRGPPPLKGRETALRGPRGRRTAERGGPFPAGGPRRRAEPPRRPARPGLSRPPPSAGSGISIQATLKGARRARCIVGAAAARSREEAEGAKRTGECPAREGGGATPGLKGNIGPQAPGGRADPPPGRPGRREPCTAARASAACRGAAPGLGGAALKKKRRPRRRRRAGRGRREGEGGGGVEGEGGGGDAGVNFFARRHFLCGGGGGGPRARRESLGRSPGAAPPRPPSSRVRPPARGRRPNPGAPARRGRPAGRGPAARAPPWPVGRAVPAVAAAGRTGCGHGPASGAAPPAPAAASPPRRTKSPGPAGLAEQQPEVRGAPGFRAPCSGGFPVCFVASARPGRPRRRAPSVAGVPGVGLHAGLSVKKPVD